MNVEDIRLYCLKKKAVTESFPFDETTLVFKVAGKMFALLSIKKSPLAINLKYDPDDAQLLRSQFEAITPGYHMNKEHWNTIILDGSMDIGLVKKLMADSYSLVVKKLSKQKRRELGLCF